MKHETVLAMSFGATREVGFDLRELGATRVMVVTDSRLAELPPVATVLESLKREGIEAVLFAETRVEPTDGSLKEAVRFPQSGRFDGFVGVGGGSSIDTAKATLYGTAKGAIDSFTRGSAAELAAADSGERRNPRSDRHALSRTLFHPEANGKIPKKYAAETQRPGS